jgi:LysM repeat protein
VYVDVVETYSSTGKIPPTNEPEGVKIRTGVSRSNADWRDEQKINYADWRTAANTQPFHQSFVTLRQKFTANRSSMKVWVEMESSYGYANNGFFLDHMQLIGPGSPPSNPQPTAKPTDAPTEAPAEPTATTEPPAAAPAATEPPPPPTAAPQPEPTEVRYVVQRGDQLGALAHRFGVTLTALATANHIVDYNRIYVGQVLTIPGTAAAAPPPAQPTAEPQSAPASAPTQAPAAAADAPNGVYVVQRGDTLGAIAKKFGVNIGALAVANHIVNYNSIYVGQTLIIPGAPSPASQLYTVQRGDTLAKVAARFGTTVAALQAANNLRNINYIYVGQILRIP